MKNKKNIFITVSSFLCMLSFLPSSTSAASYADGEKNRISDYATAAWKTIQNNPKATITGLTVAGILLYSAQLYRQMAAAKVVAERNLPATTPILNMAPQKQDLHAGDGQARKEEARALMPVQNRLKKNPLQKIKDRYRFLIGLLNRNPKINKLLYDMDKQNKPIMEQLKQFDFEINFSNKERSLSNKQSWLIALIAQLKDTSAHYAQSYNGIFKYLVKNCKLFLLHIQLKTDIETLEQLINKSSSDLQAAANVPSYHNLQAAQTY